MKTKWNKIKLVLMLIALPLVATAAATAHQLIVDAKPLSLDFEVPVVANSPINLVRAHTVALNRNGDVEGQISVIGESVATGVASLKIFFVQNGKVVNETVTDKDGAFVATAVPEGAYSFVATGENGFAAYGVHVVSDDSGKYENVMRAAAVSPRFDMVKQILSENLPTEVNSEILATQKSNLNVVGSNRVRLVDGTLNGTVVALRGDDVAGTNVHIIQNDSPVVQVQADEAGNFVVPNLEPGVYDFVASGRAGFAAVSFQAIEADQAPDQEVEIPVSIAQDSTETLDVQLIEEQDVPFVDREIIYIYRDIIWVQPEQYIEYLPVEYAVENVGLGGAVGGSYPTQYVGGYAPGRLLGAGGGPGLSRLLLLGGLAVGIVAITDDDSDPISGS